MAAHIDTLAIVGVGLIGGSIGLAAKRNGLANRVIGIGRREVSLREASQVGAVDATSTDLSAASQADLVVVCTPVAKIVDVVKQIAVINPSAMLTDAGSTKEQLCSALTGVRFVGSHPLAGDHRTGCRHARPNLLDERTVVVTPTDGSADDDVEFVTSFWQALGATVRQMSPQEHDEAVASISHVPHLVAAALAKATPQQWLSLAASGFKDTTRVAAGDPELWRQIVAENRHHVAQELHKFEQVLAQLRGCVQSADDDQLLKLLVEAKQKRDAVGS